MAALLVSACAPGDVPATTTSDAASDRGCRVEGAEPLGEGDRLPDACRVEMFDGGMRSLGDIRDGRPLVLNFWATWCSFCIKEMPDFQRVHEAAGESVAFLGLDLLGVQGETRNAARDLARQTGVRYPLAFDETAELYSRFVTAGPLRAPMPVTVFVRGDATVAHRQFGPLTAEELRRAVRTHLEEP